MRSGAGALDPDHFVRRRARGGVPFDFGGCVGDAQHAHRVVAAGAVVAQDIGLGSTAETAHPVDRAGHHGHIQRPVVRGVVVVGRGHLELGAAGGADHEGAHPQVGLQAQRRRPAVADDVEGHRPRLVGRRGQSDLEAGRLPLHHRLAQRGHVGERDERDLLALVAVVYLLDVLEDLLGGAGIELIRRHQALLAGLEHLGFGDVDVEAVPEVVAGAVAGAVVLRPAPAAARAGEQPAVRVHAEAPGDAGGRVVAHDDRHLHRLVPEQATFVRGEVVLVVVVGLHRGMVPHPGGVYDEEAARVRQRRHRRPQPGGDRKAHIRYALVVVVARDAHPHRDAVGQKRRRVQIHLLRDAAHGLRHIPLHGSVFGQRGRVHRQADVERVLRPRRQSRRQSITQAAVAGQHPVAVGAATATVRVRVVAGVDQFLLPLVVVDDAHRHRRVLRKAARLVDVGIAGLAENDPFPCLHSLGPETDLVDQTEAVVERVVVLAGQHLHRVPLVQAHLSGREVGDN